MDGHHFIKIAAISDTHGNNQALRQLVINQEKGDLFIHAGDFTSYNKRTHVQQFLELINQLDFKHKIVIPGNHEVILDGSISIQDLKGYGIFHIPQEMNRENQIQRIKDAGCLYYQHDYFEVMGLKIFASSYTPVPFYSKTGFQCSEEELQKAWTDVPTDIDILITHGPPFQILDQSKKGDNQGCKFIQKYLQKAKPKLHIFGHIHEGKGTTQIDKTRFYNVAETLHRIQLDF